MVAPRTPSEIALLNEPPSTFTARRYSKRLSDTLLVSNWRARRLPAMIFKGWLSAVPKAGLTPPTWPPINQKFARLNPPSIAAFTLVKPVPLPEKLLAGLFKFTALAYVPAARPLVLTV